MKAEKKNRGELIMMFAAWALGLFALGIIVWELKRLGLEVHIL